MSRPNYGMITVPYYEWWLHHNPFVKTGQWYNSCPLCGSDTSCFKGCPQEEIKKMLEEVGSKVREWLDRDRSKEAT